MNVHLLISVMARDSKSGKLSYRTHILTPATSIVDFIIQNPNVTILNTHKLSMLEYNKLEKFEGDIYH